MSSMPLEIEKRGDDAIRIVWDDGHESLFANTALRLACGCAACVDEWTGVQRLRREDVPPDVRPTGLDLVGHYALHVTWSDGHASGMYPWERLRALCPCASCAAGRA